MSERKKCATYVVIFADGSAQTFSDAAYLTVLDRLNQDYHRSSAVMLLRDGKVVVEEGLNMLAYRYQQARTQEWAATDLRIMQRCVESFAEEYAVG